MWNNKNLFFLGQLALYGCFIYLAEVSELSIDKISHQALDSKRYPAATGLKEESCLGLARDLVSSSTSLTRDLLKKIQANAKTKERILASINAHLLPTQQIESLLGELHSIPNDPKAIKRLEDFIEYSQTLFPKQREKLLALAPKLFDDEIFQGDKAFKGFRKRLATFDKYENLEIEKAAKKLRKENPKLNQKQALKKAKKASKESIDKWRKLYNGCHTKGLTKEHKQGAKFFTYFTISIAAGSSGIFYTASNWNEEDFGSSSFFGKLGYEMLGDAVWATMASYIFKDPTGGFVEKSVKMYLADNVLVMVDGFTWEQLFGEGEADAQEKIEELKKNPEFQQELLKLVKLLEREKFMDKVKENFASALASVMDNPPEDMNIDWESITKEDLEKDEVQEALIEAALMEMYESDTGAMSLGSYGADRWAFYTGIGLPFMFLDTAISSKIYHTMCMAPANPKKAVLMSSLIFTAYSVFYDTIAYPMRKHLINQ